jgi:DNA-binding YbaB/EbfC family protein
VNPFGDPRKLMKQVQEMQERVQQEIAALRIEATSGGGMVKVVMTGEKKVEALTIDPEVVNKDDVGMLQDLILAAIHEATNKVEAELKDKIGALTGGMKIPGLF